MRAALRRAALFVVATALAMAGSVMTTQTPPVSAKAASPASCETVEEVSDYVPLYELDVPRTAYWAGEANVPYTVNKSLKLDNTPSMPYLDRVAYCLDIATTAGTHEWAYASFDAYTNDPRLLGVPNTTTARRVKGLTTWGSNVSHVERAEGGYIEFWPGTYSPATAPSAPAGDGDTYDFSDTPSGSDSGYGSMQVHNTANRETVLALNGWSYGSGRYLDVGTGNQESGHPD